MAGAQHAARVLTGVTGGSKEHLLACHRQQQLWHIIFRAHSCLDGRKAAEVPPGTGKILREDRGGVRVAAASLQVQGDGGQGAAADRKQPQARCLCCPQPAPPAPRVRTGLRSYPGRLRRGK